MKHVYLVENGSRAGQYGVGTYVRQMVEFLKQVSAVRLTVVLLNSDVEEVSEEFDESGIVRYLKIPVQQEIGSKADMIYCYRNIAYLLATYLAPCEENVLHLNYLHHLSLVEWLKKMKVHFRLIVTIHYFDWCFMLKGNTRLFRSLINKGRTTVNEWREQVQSAYERDKKLFGYADQVICLTSYTQSLLHDVYEVEDRKVTLIYNGLKDEAIELNEEDRLRKKGALGFRETDRIILFVGRLDENKGIKCLIASFRQVLKVAPESKLLIVGDGNYGKYLKECADLWTRVIFTGKVEKEQLYAFYQIADVGVLPSFHEQCSYVGIEMLMHGLPLIGTDGGGLKEMVEGMSCLPLEEKEGEWVLSTDLLSQWIIEIQTHPQSVQYRKRFEERYTLQRMAEKMLPVYLNL